jgi:hypothetical protein
MTFSTRVGGSVLALFASSLVAACSSDDEHACTAIGCGAEFTLVAPLPVPFETVQTLRAEVCQNGKCLRESLASMVKKPEPYAGVGVAFPDAQTIEATKSARVDVRVAADQAGNLRLEVSYWPWSFNDVTHGDTFKVTLTDTAGAAAFSFERALNFTESYPNGPQCGPPCRQAAVQLD